MLDASFLIDHLKGDEGAVQRFDQLFNDGDEPFVSFVAVCEVDTGLAPADARAFLKQKHAVPVHGEEKRHGQTADATSHDNIVISFHELLLLRKTLTLVISNIIIYIITSPGRR